MTISTERLFDGAGLHRTPTSRRRLIWLCLGGLALAVVGCALGALVLYHKDSCGNSEGHSRHTHDLDRSLLLLVGDSLTELGESSDQKGWITQLRADYTRAIDIVSRGYSGYNTKWHVEYVLPLIEQDLDAYPEPALITIWLGANDAALANSSTSSEQHVPLDEYKANLFTIAQRLRAKAPSANVILITPPTVDDEKRREVEDGDLDRSNEQTGVYATACVEQAAAMNLPVLDLYSHFNAMDESDRNGYFVDGLHFNSAGNSVMKQQLMAALSDAFPKLVDAMKTPSLPGWKELL